VYATGADGSSYTLECYVLTENKYFSDKGFTSVFWVTGVDLLALP